MKKSTLDRERKRADIAHRNAVKRREKGERISRERAAQAQATTTAPRPEDAT